MNMRFEFVFALAFLGLALFNSLRAWWFWRKQQRIMMVVSLCFLGVALIASAYMGVAGWKAQRQQERDEAAQVAPLANDQK